MRIAVVATSSDDLVEKLQKATPHHISDSVVKEPKAVFVFSGQGSQVSLIISLHYSVHY
jgi:acyl transferase domain-containing protein